MNEVKGEKKWIPLAIVIQASRKKKARKTKISPRLQGLKWVLASALHFTHSLWFQTELTVVLPRGVLRGRGTEQYSGMVTSTDYETTAINKILLYSQIPREGGMPCHGTRCHWGCTEFGQEAVERENCGQENLQWVFCMK